MSEKVGRLVKAALELSPEDHEAFFDAFHVARCRMEEESPLDEAWLEEIERRSAEIDREAKTYSWEEVKESVKRRLADHGPREASDDGTG